MKYYNIYLFLFMFSFALACDNQSESTATAEVKSSSAVKKSCSDEVEEYTDWLSEFFSPTTNEQDVISNLNLLWYDGEDLPTDIAVIVLGETELSLHTDSVKKYSLSRLKNSLRQDMSIADLSILNKLIQQLAASSSSKNQSVALAVSGDAPVEVLLAILQRLEGKYQVGFVVLSSSIKAPTLFPKQALPEDLNERIKQMEKVWANCTVGFEQQGQLMMLSSVSGTEDQAAIDQNFSEIRNSLQQCKCQVDLAVVKAQNYSFLQQRKRQKKVVWVSFDTDQKPMISSKRSWLENGTKLLQEFAKGNTSISLETGLPVPPPPPPPRKKK